MGRRNYVHSISFRSMLCRVDIVLPPIISHQSTAIADRQESSRIMTIMYTVYLVRVDFQFIIAFKFVLLYCLAKSLVCSY